MSSSSTRANTTRRPRRDNIESRRPSTGAGITHHCEQHSLVFAEGPSWKHQRNITSKLFSFECLNAQMPLMRTITDEHLADLDCENAIELVEVFKGITGEISVAVFFGRSIEAERLYGQPLTEVLQELSREMLAAHFHPVTLLTGGRVLPTTFRNKARDVRAALRSLVSDEI